MVAPSGPETLRAFGDGLRIERVTDWRVVRDLRLRALRDDGRAFAADLRSEAARGERDWHALVDAATWVVAVAGGHAIGMARAVGGKGWRHIESVWVDPGHRRRGVASRMLGAMLELERAHGERQLRIWVLHGNHEARMFYRGLGFVPTGELKPLPENPERTEERMRISLR
jgi:ribosomal protein S18 acetylase RimI-like enzyme